MWEPAMNSVQVAVHLALVLLGGTGLFEGLSHLSSSPFPSVLIILSAMLFLLFPIAGLCGAEVVRSRRVRREKSWEERAE
jgi:hypothetical protein